MSTKRWSVFSRKNYFAATFPTWMLPLKFNVFLHICTNCVCVWAVTSQLKSLCSLDFEQMDENRRVDGQMCWNSRRSLKMAARVRTEDWRSALSNGSLPWIVEGWLPFIIFGGTTQTSDAWMRLQKETEKLRGLYEANNSNHQHLQDFKVSNKILKLEPEDECLAFIDRRQKRLWQLPQDADRKCNSSVLLDILFFMTQSWKTKFCFDVMFSCKWSRRCPTFMQSGDLTEITIMRLGGSSAGAGPCPTAGSGWVGPRSGSGALWSGRMMRKEKQPLQMWSHKPRCQIHHNHCGASHVFILISITAVLSFTALLFAFFSSLTHPPVSDADADASALRAVSCGKHFSAVIKASAGGQSAVSTMSALSTGTGTDRRMIVHVHAFFWNINLVWEVAPYIWKPLCKNMMMISAAF